MAKRRTSKPMETQPVVTDGPNLATPMGSQPSKPSKAIRSPGMPPAKAERSRQSSLRKQRDQIGIKDKRRKRSPAGSGGSLEQV